MKVLNPHSSVLLLFWVAILVVSMLNILTSLVTGFYYLLIITLSVFFRSCWIIDCHQQKILPAKLSVQLYLSDSAQFSSAIGT